MSETGRLEAMASTPSKSTPAKATQANTTRAETPQTTAGTPADRTVAEVQSGSPNPPASPPAPSSDPSGEAAQRRAEEARIQQTPDAERDDEDQPEEDQETSSKEVQPGDHLWYRGDYGPVFALVTGGGEGGADVLLLRDSEVPRARTVAVYDSAEDAEKGYGQGREHVAWHI